MRGPMLGGDMLSRAFRAFDRDGKGYIAVEDLQVYAMICYDMM